MANSTGKIYYRIDLRKTLESMEINLPVVIRITGINRDCDINAIYYAKSSLEDKSDKRFTITKKEFGKLAEVNRIR